MNWSFGDKNDVKSICVYFRYVLIKLSIRDSQVELSYGKWGLKQVTGKGREVVEMLWASELGAF